MKTDMHKKFVSPNVLLPAPRENAVTVVVAVDKNYVPHLAALIESIKEFFSKDRFLDFIVLEGGIDNVSKILLEKQFFINFESGHIYFIDCKNLYKNIETHSHFTTAIFYRIAIARILPNHSKVLYLDTDMIALSDISVLFDTDLAENLIGAACDIGVRSFLSQGEKKKIPRKIKGLGGLPLSKYVSDYLGLGEDADRYFQSGVILFNLNKFRESNVEELAANDLFEKKYWLSDQDVLNKHLKSKFLEIDAAWNCLSFSGELYKNLPHDLSEKVKNNFQNPKIVHYARADEKPWNNADGPLAYFYWFFLRRTFFYEQVLQSMSNKKRVFKKIFQI